MLRAVLWAAVLNASELTAVVTGGGAELGFSAHDEAAVNGMHDDWRARGIAIAQSPTQTDFGYTFVGLDPDGHRLRVLFAPSDL
jgi:predicted lactoylglutathione lyase